MGKKSRKSSRRQRPSTASKKTLRDPDMPEKRALHSKAEQLIALSQARRRKLRANVAALTHLLLKHSQLAATVQQMRITPQAARLSPNQQLFGEVGVSIVNEISQPLNAILSNLGAASNLLGAGPLELREILTDVRADTLRACEIVEDMRDLFGGRITRKAPLQVNAIVENLLKTLGAEARQHRISLMADLSADLPKVYADGPQIEQAIANLVRNGMDAMADIHPRERSLVIATRSLPEELIEISVCDRGDGISPNVLPRIFETYFTTKPDRMGLGLAVARSIAELHQGTLIAENNRGRGATFRMQLPVSSADGPARTVIRALTAGS